MPQHFVVLNSRFYRNLNSMILVITYLNSSMISFLLAWNGIFRTRILDDFCLPTSCAFRCDFASGLEQCTKQLLRWFINK